MYIGSHVSIRDGYAGAAKIAHAIGADCFQYFPKNPRSLSLKSFDIRDAKACADFSRAHGLRSIAHSAYLINLASSDAELRKLMALSLLNDLTIAEACGSIGVVVHFGKYRGNALLQGYQNCLQLINEVLAEWTGDALLLIENQAGEGSPMGITLEELAQIRQLAERPERIGFCLDTCHAFAGGLWNGRNWREVEARGEALGYFAHLRAIHLNDSVYGSGSRKDRHANIGRGTIGEQAMRELLQSPLLAGVPFVLETPQSAALQHREEIRYVRRLAGRE